jgi:hypothetical protein
MVMPAAFELANLLAPRPLDRVQLCTRRALVEADYWYREYRELGQSRDLPWWYFQFITPDGKYALCSPGGQRIHVSPLDIADIIPSKSGPVIVRAMPEHQFLERLGLPLAQRQRPPKESDYEPAMVVGASKNRWNQVETYVRFVDASLNARTEGVSRIAPLIQADYAVMAKKARRTIMPVVSRSASNWSADHGIANAEAKVRNCVSAFIQASVTGHDDESRRLACASLRSA